MESTESADCSLEEVHDIADLLVSLRELLTNAFDDLIDEETSSISSNDSRDSGTHSGEKLATANTVTWPNWPGGAIAGYASTPIGHHIPPPPGGIHFPGFGQTFPIHPGYHFPPFNYPGYIRPLSPGTNQHFPTPYEPRPLQPREETEGGNETPEHSISDTMASTPPQEMMHGNKDPSQYPISDGETESIGNCNNNNQDGQHVQYNPNSAKYRSYSPVPMGEKTRDLTQFPVSEDSDNVNVSGARLQLTRHKDFHKSDSMDEQRGGDLSPGRVSNGYDNYRVEYLRNGEEQFQLSPSNGGIESHRTDYQQFVQQAGSTEDRENAQLQILYAARGRQLEELQQKFDEVKDTTAREIRVLKHQLAMSEGEKGGVAGSLEESSRLIQSLKQENADLHCKVSTLQSQVADVCSTKDQVLRNLQAAETTIENLNQQLFEVRSSESMTRARELHESVLSNMKQKQEQEVYQLNEKMDQVQRQLEEKVDEVNQLRQQLSESVKAADRGQIDRADTINRLTRSLEDSQRQCRDLLESGASNELGSLRIQLNQAVASKCISEDLCKTLQTELNEVKEQMSYFEAASQLGVLPGFSSSGEHSDISPSESFSQLNIRKSNIPLSWKTPKTHQSEKDMHTTPEEVVPKLKSEMQRILLNNKAKREQVSNLQGELKSTKEQLNEWRRKHEESEGLCKKLQENVDKLKAEVDSLTPDSTGVSGREKTMKRQLESLLQERESLCQELEEVKSTLAEVGSSEERVTEINAELRQQMAQMVSDYDEDKEIALKKCQEACLRHHDTAKEDLRKTLEANYETTRLDLQKDFEIRLEAMKAELLETQQQLDNVKELYVNTCREKDEVENLCKEKYEKELENRMIELKCQLKKEKEDELKQVREDLESKTVSELKEQWSRGQEPQINRLVESRVAAAKTEWFEEQKTTKLAAIKKAVDLKQQELQLMFDSKLDQEVQTQLLKAKSEWQTDRRLSFESELQQRLVREKEKWQAMADQGTDVAVTEAISKARMEWMSSLDEKKQKISSEAKTKLDDIHKAEVVAKVRQAVEEAGEKWKKDKDSAVKTAVSKAVKEAEEKWKIDKDYAVEAAVSEALEEAEEKWKKDKDCAVKIAVSEASSGFQETISKMSDEFASLKSEKELIEQELETESRNWHQEKTILSKEIEDIRGTLAHTEGLLERSRQRGHALEKEVNTVKDELRESQRNLSEKDFDWRQKLSKQQEVHEEEYQKFLREQRDSLDAALKRSREEFELEKVNIEKLHQDAIQILNEKNEHKIQHELNNVTKEWSSKLDRLHKQLEQKSPNKLTDDSWLSERAKLVSEIEHRDDLLQSADTHLEQEINKLRQDMENTHQQQLQEELAKLRRESLTSEEKQMYLNELSDAQKQLKYLENTYEHQIEALQEKLRMKESLISEQQVRFEERLQSVNKESAIKISDVEQNLEQLNIQLQKSESRKQELKGLLAKSESDQEQILSRYKQRNEELNQRVQSLEASYDKAQGEHQVAMETMKSKMMQLRQEHDSLTEGLKREHSRERLLMEKKAKLLKDREVEEKDSQTDRSEVHAPVTDKMKKQYMQTIKKIKGEVMKHVNDTNTRAAQTVKVQVAKARQETGKQLRKYYLQCLNDILSDPNCMDKAVQKSRMELALQLPGESHAVSTTSSTTNILQEDHMQRLFDQPMDDGSSVDDHYTSARGRNPPQHRNYDKVAERRTQSPNSTSPWNERLVKKSNNQGGQAPYKYTSLKETAAKNNTGLSSLYVSPVDAGLNCLPQQPRQYNPPPEKLSSAESSRCSSPIDNTGLTSARRNIMEPEKLHSKENSHINPAPVSKIGKSSGVMSSRRQPMRALPNEDVQRMLAKVPLEAKKPVAMVTQQTQIPSPLAFKGSK